MSEHITLDDIYNALEKLREPPADQRLHFFVQGTGIPEELAIDYWADSGVIVVDNEGRRWLHGKLLV